MKKRSIKHIKYGDGGKPPKREPIIVTNPNDPRLKAYNDSLFAYNKYKDKDEWIGGKNVLKFKTKNEEQQYNDLYKKMESIQNMEYAEQDKLWANPNFRKLNQDEQFKRLMSISNKYTNNKSYKDIAARVNYLNTENTSVQGAKYVPKWYDNKNITVRGLKPISWDEKEEQEVQAQYNTTTNQYGTIIDKNTPVANTKASLKTTIKYSPNFKKPVQPVIYQKPKPKPTPVDITKTEPVKPVVKPTPTVTQQQPVKPLPFRAKYVMPDTSANPNMQGQYPLQMFYQPAATQAEADSIEQAMNKKRIELQNYMRNLPKKATGGYVDNNPLEVYGKGGKYEAISMAEGGIHIKPENRGKFTAWAKSKGMGVQEAASHVLANKDRYSPTVVKRANFAHNAAKWKHGNGGTQPMVRNPNELMDEVPMGWTTQGQAPLSITPQSLDVTDFFYANQADVKAINPLQSFKPVQPTTTPSGAPSIPTETPESDMYNPSLAGVMTQIGSGIIGTGAQLRNINRLKAPGVVPRVNFTPMGSPALVDMGAQLSDIDRSYREGQEMINREIGSGAGKVANLAKLQAAKLAGKGQVLQAEETANAQIKNQFLQMRNEMKMREQAMNQQAALENIANRYGYDLTTTQGRNAAIATLTNLVSQAGGAYTGLESQKLGLSGLSKAYTPGLATRQGFNEMMEAWLADQKKGTK